ncbi:hypothetical protein QJS04_geneDACA020133 [Acorus gramineus]|uniref:Uncharacterized protein n=1 Tax=Acorus gramineus TaxID=55184 RepID=A0AAV9BMT0_ACOGR|nr:hypothetical protein QJS04_geneDACA020133 [Acorus gramineus]
MFKGSDGANNNEEKMVFVGFRVFEGSYNRRLMENETSFVTRTDANQQLSDEDVYLPGLLPKILRQFYYLFGNLIEIRGMEKVLEDESKANSIVLGDKIQGGEDNVLYEGGEKWIHKEAS